MYLNHPGIPPCRDVNDEEVDSKTGTRKMVKKDDAANFNKHDGVLRALKIFLGEEGQLDVLRITAAVLHLGNIEMGGKGSKCDLDVNQPAVQDFTELLGLDPNLLKEVFATMHLGRIKADVSPTLARKFRDALAKTIYNKQFEYLVEKCSEMLNSDPRCATSPFIGVLDIFGFEYILESKLNPPQSLNSFEQFCINLCNEKLQNLFVGLIFDMENAMYAEEGLGKVEIEFKRNDDTLAILEGNTNSVFSQLDNVAGLSKKDMEGRKDWDQTFYDGLKKLAKDKSRNKGSRIREASMKEYRRRFGDRVPQGGFYVEHYAANVLYDPQEWNAKNTDFVSPDIKEMVGTSDISFLSNIFKELATDKKPATTLKYFKNQLGRLVKHLAEDCQTGFVRTIKPNREKVPNVYTADLVLQQLAYTGMLSTLQIQKGGYSSRLPWATFADEFRVLDVNAEGHEALVASIEKTIPEILENMRHKPTEKMQDKPIVVGIKRCVLTRDWLYRELKTRANMIKGQAAVTVQAVYRGMNYSGAYLAKNNAILGTEGGVGLQALMRTTLQHMTYLQSKWVHLQVSSRTGLHRMIRATRRRMIYYKERTLEFEHINRQDIQRYIYAFLQRQRYYEAKIKHAEGDQVNAERERFQLYEGFTVEMNHELLMLEREAAQERWAMRMEEDYTNKLEDAKVLGKLQQAKEEDEALCEHQYNTAKAQYQKIVKAQEDEDRIENHLSTEAHAKLMNGARHVVEEFLVEQGITPSGGKMRLTAPSLKELPSDRDNVTEMRAYYYGAAAMSIRDNEEEPQSEMPVMMSIVNDATDRMLAGRLELPPTTPRDPASGSLSPNRGYGSPSRGSPFDPATFTPRQRDAFQRQIADLLNIMRESR